MQSTVTIFNNINNLHTLIPSLILCIHNFVMLGAVYVTFTGLAAVPTWTDYSIMPPVDLYCVANGGPSSSRAITAGTNGAMYKTINGGAKPGISMEAVFTVVYCLLNRAFFTISVYHFESMHLDTIALYHYFLPTHQVWHTLPTSFFWFNWTGMSWSALTVSNIPTSDFKYHAIGEPAAVASLDNMQHELQLWL